MPSQLFRLVWLVPALVIPLAAQQGSVSGTVVGLDGKAAKNATVVLRELKAVETKSLSVGDRGEFEFAGVPPGTYVVNACGSDFRANSNPVNVGPTDSQPNPHQTVALTAIPKAEGEGSGVAFILLFFVFAILLFWYRYPTNLFYLRVPIISWTLWAPLFIVLFNTQHALLALKENTAVWAGAASVFVAICICQSASTIAKGADARFAAAPKAGSSDAPGSAEQVEVPPKAGSSDTEVPAAQVEVALKADSRGLRDLSLTVLLYPIPLLFLYTGVLAFNSWRSGEREWGPYLSAGAVVGFLVWGAARLLVAWIIRFVFVPAPSRAWLKELVRWLPVLVTAFIGLAGYWFLYHARSSALETGTALTLGSPIIHLLFLMAELCLLLSALAYFLDKFRVPLLTILLLLIGIGVACHRGDYVFESHAGAGPRPGPSEAIAGRNRIIVVAAAGGGVQAAAWTARVLSGLAQADQRFQPAVRMISGVSGGSVGTMYFINTYPATEGGMGWSGDRAFRSASAPLLDAVAWGLVSVDLRHDLAGTRNNDRGAILSQTLGARAGLGGARLSRWSDGVSAGLPAVLLNATEVETGSPIVFSSTTLDSYGILDFASVYGRDTEIPTAVRLSASFPFVTPVARLQGQDEQGRPYPHLADGGYYDNYGMYSLMAWLQEALAGSTQPPEVLVLRIEALPDSPGRTSPQGWPFQTWAPLTAMMSVRTEAQRHRNETSFHLFQQQYKLGVIRELIFQYEPPCACPPPPLSWDLSPVEIECVDRAWKSQNVQQVALAVQKFLDAR